MHDKFVIRNKQATNNNNKEHEIYPKTRTFVVLFQQNNPNIMCGWQVIVLLAVMGKITILENNTEGKLKAVN